MGKPNFIPEQLKMKIKKNTLSRICMLTFLVFGISNLATQGQQISKQELLALTPNWKGERFDDGRPKVSDELLKRLKLATLGRSLGGFKK